MITSKIHNNKNILAFDNITRLNFLNIDEIADFLEKKITDSDHDLYLNLGGIEFIDSCAFEKLLAIHRAGISVKKMFKLFNVSADLRELFIFTGISRQLDITDSSEVYQGKSINIR
jgi:anti-anti-sigma factor